MYFLENNNQNEALNILHLMSIDNFEKEKILSIINSETQNTQLHYIEKIKLKQDNDSTIKSTVNISSEKIKNEINEHNEKAYLLIDSKLNQVTESFKNDKIFFQNMNKKYIEEISSLHKIQTQTITNQINYDIEKNSNLLTDSIHKVHQNSIISFC